MISNRLTCLYEENGTNINVKRHTVNNMLSSRFTISSALLRRAKIQIQMLMYATNHIYHHQTDTEMFGNQRPCTRWDSEPKTRTWIARFWTTTPCVQHRDSMWFGLQTIWEQLSRWTRSFDSISYIDWGRSTMAQTCKIVAQLTTTINARKTDNGWCPKLIVEYQDLKVPVQNSLPLNCLENWQWTWEVSKFRAVDQHSQWGKLKLVHQSNTKIWQTDTLAQYALTVWSRSQTLLRHPAVIFYSSTCTSSNPRSRKS